MGGEWILGTVNILRYSAFWISADSTLLGQRELRLSLLYASFSQIAEGMRVVLVYET
jgi:hypothetical protein